MDITAEVAGVARRPDALTRVRGQVEVATTDGVIASIASSPPTRRLPARRRGVASADWVVLGPGSWFTSVIPHLMVPACATRWSRPTPGRRRAQPRAPGGETAGFGPPTTSPSGRARPELRVHTVLANERHAGSSRAEQAVAYGATWSSRRREGDVRHAHADRSSWRRRIHTESREGVDARERIATWR
jgi:hypothetical protein